MPNTIGSTDFSVYVHPWGRGYGVPLSERWVRAAAVLEARSRDGMSGALMVTLPDTLESGIAHAISVVTPEDGIYTTLEFEFRPWSFNGPLTVSAPGRGAVIHRGEWIDVVLEPTVRPLYPQLSYMLMCYDTYINCVSRDDRLVIGSAIHRDGRFRFQVPDTFPNCEEVRILVDATPEYDCYPHCPRLMGESTTFRSEVYAQSQGYKVVTPGYGDTYRSGGVIHAHVTVSNNAELSGPLEVYLYQILEGIRAHYVVSGVTFELLIPDDLRLEPAVYEQFQIIVFDQYSPEGTEKSAWSDRFRIIP